MAAVNKAADADALTNIQIVYRRSNGTDAPNDFVPGNQRIDGHTPVVVHEMKISMTDTTKVDIDLNVAKASLSPLNTVWDELFSSS